MSIAVVQQRSAAYSGTTGNLAYTSNVTAGNLLVVAFTHNGSLPTPTISDSRSNSYSSARNLTTNSGTGFHTTLFDCIANTSGANTVTITVPNSASGGRIRVYEFSGVDTATPFNNSTVLSENNTAPRTGTITPALANSLYFAMIEGAAAPFVSTASFTTLESNSDTFPDIQDSWQIHTGTTALEASWTDGAGRTVAHLTVYRPASGGGPTPAFRPYFITG